MSGLSVSRRVALSLILAAASWGIGTAISKRAVLEFPPLTLLPIQLAVSLITLLLIVRWRGESVRAASVPTGLGRLGLLNPGLAYALSLVGLTQISASLSVLLWALEPVMILVLAALVLAERAGRAVIALSGVAVGGMVLVLYSPDGIAGGHELGVILTLAGVGCCAVYSVIARRWIDAAGSTLQVIVVQQAYALALALIVLAGVAILGGPVLPTGLSAEGALSGAASGIVYYGLAYFFYLHGLRRVRASIAAVSFYLIPVFGIAAGSVLGERFDGRQWIGVAIVLGAVSLIAHRASSPATLPVRST